MLPRIFFCLRTATNFLMTVPFMYNYRNLSNKFPTIFCSLILVISLPGYDIFRRKLRKPKIFRFKNTMERRITKILTFVKC